MQYHLQNNKSNKLIVFFSGWGCDEHQFINLQDNKDVLILYDYQNLELEFDFSKYQQIDIIAYSAGVFIASVVGDKIPNVSKIIAVCGTPYLFDEKLGLSQATIELFNSINLDNYMDFRRQYMVETDDEFKRYNQLESQRSLESCQQELVSLQQLYQKHKKDINPKFDFAIAAENDVLFNLEEQKDFYKNKLHIIPQTKHHIFFKFKNFEEIVLINNK